MSTFSVEPFAARIEAHPNADAIEICRVGGYCSIVKKGQFKDGEPVLFIPPQAVLPDDLLEALELWDHEKGKGRLKGRDGNRLMPVRLRGVLSEGVCMHPIHGAEPGMNYADKLGITKWVPTPPAGAAGDIYHASGVTGYSELENQEKPLPNGDATFTLVDGLDVVISEKLHGSCCIFYLDEQDNFHVTSKGHASKGFVLKEPANPARNWYWYAAHRYGMRERLEKIKSETGADRVTLYGEVYGNGVQDLTYGMENNDKQFRAFDLKLGHIYADYARYEELMSLAGIETVPYLYRGTCSMERVLELRDGVSTLDNKTVREGVVIRPVVEQYDTSGSRIVVKAVSPAYKCRKNGTEFN